nr:MAG TPA: hypothetical protein [Caudoviricetes sp.]
MIILTKFLHTFLFSSPYISYIYIIHYVTTKINTFYNVFYFIFDTLALSYFIMFVNS